MYFTTTRDFQTFTPTKLFLDPGFSVIDCQIISTRSSGRESAQTSDKASDGANSRSLLQESGPAYVLILKDNTRPQRNIRVAFSDTPLGPWRDISPIFTEKLTEGPCGLKLGDDWFIYYDSYNAKHYSAMKTRDFKPSPMSRGNDIPAQLEARHDFRRHEEGFGLPLESQHSDGAKRRSQVCAETVPGGD
jgi:hypothetical protein